MSVAHMEVGGGLTHRQAEPQIPHRATDDLGPESHVRMLSIGSAATAGAIPGCEGGFDLVEPLDVLRPRRPTGAADSADDSRRPHRVVGHGVILPSGHGKDQVVERTRNSARSF